MTHALSVGAVVAVRALDPLHTSTYDGLADVVAVEFVRAMLDIRPTRWV